MLMTIQENVPLSAHSTMRLGGIASFLTEVSSDTELVEAWQWAKDKNVPVLIIGDGSNIVWRDEGFPGLVIVNRILGFRLQNFDENTAALTVAGGETWDSVVERTVQAGYYTLAPLSLIPGTAGATPVQNVGAYGQEVSKCLMTIKGLDTTTGKLAILRASDCKFAYRTSRFKTDNKGKFFITELTFSISKIRPEPPYYEAVERYVRQKNKIISSPQDLREIVVAIRTSKLPDPKVVANNGSFFANPIVSDEQLMQILGVSESAKYWHVGDNQVKLSAAWLVEQAGFKNFHDQETGMATWQYQPLVLVNEHAKSTLDLITFKTKIVTAVKEKFGVTLEQEPELLP